MRRKAWIVVGLLMLGGLAFAQESASGGTLSPAAQDLIRMARAGVEESVMSTYVRTRPTPFALSTDDVLALKAAGVPQSVIAEALGGKAGSPSLVEPSGGGISQDQLFRLRFGYILYQGEAYSYRNGLSPTLQKVLQADPAVEVDLRDFARLQAGSRALSWAGLGLVIGGAVYGIATANQGWSSADLNGGIVYGAIGAGLVAAIISGITDHSALISLYDGLAQYNRDLIAQSSKKGNP